MVGRHRTSQDIGDQRGQAPRGHRAGPQVAVPSCTFTVAVAWACALALGCEPWVIRVEPPAAAPNRTALTAAGVLRPGIGASTEPPAGVEPPMEGLATPPQAPSTTCLAWSGPSPAPVEGVATGACGERTLLLRNCGAHPVGVAQAVAEGAPASVQGVTKGMVIESGAERAIQVRICPVVAGSWSITVRVEAVDGVSAQALIHGTAVVGCLVPRLTVAAAAVPGAEVVASVEDSLSPTGASLVSTWTISPPGGVGSTTTATGTAVTFTPTFAGAWRICAHVHDSMGTVACHPACADVSVTPADGIYAELHWISPGDPNPHDTGPGAAPDLDLHLGLVPQAGLDRDCDGQPDPWFGGVWDVWADSPHASWGAVGDHDDGVMLRTDADGDGPESIVVVQPLGTSASPTTYTVAVHGRADHGLGASLATVRIWIGGVPAAELGPVAVYAADLWVAARIRWPNAIVGGGPQAIVPCYQTGEPCAGGYRWIAAGMPCLRSCVMPPGQALAPACADGLTP